MVDVEPTEPGGIDATLVNVKLLAVELVAIGLVDAELIVTAGINVGSVDAKAVVTVNVRPKTKVIF
jgi:hypothetical protein